jgi:hypothetical protein
VARTAEGLFHDFSVGVATDAALSLLRSRDALLHLALMSAHLGDGRIVDGHTLAALIGDDLLDLRAVVNADVGDAEGLLSRWVRRGWAHRSLDVQTRTERYQLTSGASQAVRQVRSLQQRGSVATQPALAMMMGELRRIAGQANPDPAVRIRQLDEQIQMLAAERDALAAGEPPVVDQQDLADRLTALSQLMERIPVDLARYGEQMHANTAALLRQSLTGDPASFAVTLQQMFDGHDVIAGSPEGQAFRAFTHLIGMPSQRAQIEDDIGEILARLRELPAGLQDTLASWIDTMWQRVQEVERVRRAAFGRVSAFVRSGDAAYHRSMRARVTEAQAAAAGAFAVASGGRDTGFTVPLAGLASASAGRLRVTDGAPVPPEPVTDASGEFVIDPAALAGREAINWGQLRAAIHNALDAHGGFATLPEVLAQLPAARTGDIVGLWSLAARYGETDDTAREVVLAATSRGLREITVPYLVFAEPPPEPSAAASWNRHLDPQQMTLEGEDLTDEQRA